MGLFSPSRWESNALVMMSDQLAQIERKLNKILDRLDDNEALVGLAKKLDTSTGALESGIERNKRKEKGK